MSRSTSRQRFNMWLMTVFGACALLLAAIGIYGLMAYSVEQRTQEIGIRLALGAQARQVKNMVVRQGMLLALIGRRDRPRRGVSACRGSSRAFLFGVQARDPLVFVGRPARAERGRAPRGLAAGAPRQPRRSDHCLARRVKILHAERDQPDLCPDLVCTARSGLRTSPTGDPQVQTRPKIGLALGGGSARGIAHVGVLEWFEEHHIPIDFIVGTSMGGLIAGAYASGMTPDEIGELMKTADWDLMFLSDSPYSYKTFRRKQDKREFPSQLEFGLKHGVSLPGSLNPGQQVALLLDRIALPYGDLRIVRRPADAVPRGRDRPAQGRSRRARPSAARAGDARDDGDPGGVRADQLGRLAAG